MWVSGDVDLPDPISDALTDERLVIFAGAGVSVAPPSELPGFRSLVERLGRDGGRPPSEKDLDQPDVFLGSLAEAGMRIKEQTVELLTPAAAAPNGFHRSLLRLFRTAGKIRIVTTNHDSLFQASCLELYGTLPDTFFAPALPVGDDFSGIVYLHGSVLRDPRHLVLTDDDFGRAYLTQGWATTFLRSMYARFDVLFVGYSHAEPVLKYLARGLATGNRRYAFAPGDADMTAWRRLGIDPVVYPLAADPLPHSRLEDALSKWAELATMGNLEVHGLVAKPPVLSPEEHDYLRRALKSTETARLFATENSDPAWLDWIVDAAEFRTLFASAEPPAEAVPLAGWFCREFVLTHPEDALAVAQRMGAALSQVLWISVAHTLWTAESLPDAPVFGRWVGLLIETAAFPECGRYLGYLLQKCRWPEDRETALLLFEHLTEPHAVLQRRFGLSDAEERVSIDVVVHGDADMLSGAWRELFLPHLDDVRREIEVIVTRNTGRAQLLKLSAGEAGAFDSLSLRRARIARADDE